MNFLSHGGGALIYVIIGVSVLALALFFERSLYLFLRLKLNMDKAFKKVIYHLQKPDYRAAIEECTRFEKHPLGRILKAGLLKSDKKDKEIERALEEKILHEIPRVKAKVNYLTLFANISTLLGLLGTIMGLITSFQSVSSAN
ncbi:MAG: MotA/TolQ/ExbB proton channel family protein, partial [Deltaproteobacteria bacterium]|nr:MotA/TolQ/ExbB proton channel family protein [Deltaproteobacteria bacterium]